MVSIKVSLFLGLDSSHFVEVDVHALELKVRCAIVAVNRQNDFN